MQKNSKEQIKAKLDELEIKADHYSRTDRVAYDRVQSEIKGLDEEYMALMVAETTPN